MLTPGSDLNSQKSEDFGVSSMSPKFTFLFKNPYLALLEVYFLQLSTTLYPLPGFNSKMILEILSESCLGSSVVMNSTKSIMGLETAMAIWKLVH